MAKNAKPTAAQAYQGCQNDVGALLDLIGQEMKRHAEYAKTDGLNWGHVGDVLHVRKCLIETLAQLAQQDEAFIETHLAEMRWTKKARANEDSRGETQEVIRQRMIRARK